MPLPHRFHVVAGFWRRRHLGDVFVGITQYPAPRHARFPIALSGLLQQTIPLLRRSGQDLLLSSPNPSSSRCSASGYFIRYVGQTGLSRWTFHFGYLQDKLRRLLAVSVALLAIMVNNVRQPGEAPVFRWAVRQFASCASMMLNIDVMTLRQQHLFPPARR